MTAKQTIPRVRLTLVWAIIATFAVGAIALWLVPTWLADSLAPITNADRVRAMGDARTGAVAFLVACGAFGTLMYTGRTYRMTMQGQIADRFTKAAEHLTSGKSSVSVAGVYALGRLAPYSSEDDQAVQDVICAVLREQCPADQPIENPWIGAACLTVLRQIRQRQTTRACQLSYLNLSGQDLADINLVDAEFNDTILERAVLAGANLSGANLLGAVLTGAEMYGCNLSYAVMTADQLTGKQKSEVKGADLIRWEGDPPAATM